MPYIGQAPQKGDENNFKILDDVSSYTLTFDGSDASVVSAANDTITSNNHRFITGQRVTYNKGGGTVITGLSDGVYFIIKEDHNTIKLATSESNAISGTAVNITNVGAGSSHTIVVAFDGVNTKFKATHNSGTKAKITRSAQLVVSINGVIQQPHDSTAPSTGFGFDLDGVIVLSQAPAASDVFWAHVLTNNNVTFDISDNTVDTFEGDGSDTTFNLSKTPPNNENVLVTIDGVVQYPDDASNTRAYTVVENVLTFTSAPANGTEIQVRHIGFAGASTAAVTGFYGRSGNATLKSTDNITVNDAAITGNTTVTGNISAVDATFSGNLTVQGTTTTLDTQLVEVDKIEVETAGTNVAVAVTHNGTGDLVRLYDGASQVVTVDDEGKVGIGSAIPAQKLDVVGVSKFQGEVQLSSGNQIKLSNNANTASATIDCDGGARLHLKSYSQSVATFEEGVGTIFYQSSGTARLTIQPTGGVVVGAGGTIYMPEYIKHSGDTDTYFGFPAADTITAETAGTERLRITSGGDVSIGSTADALRRVDVVGNSLLVRPTNVTTLHSSGNADAVNNSIIVRMPYGENAASQSNAGARFGIQFTGANNTVDVSSLNFGNDPVKSASIYGVSEDVLGYNRKVGLAFYTSELDAVQEERLRISSSGRVGIGTNNPNAQLDVYKTGTGTVVDTIITRTSGGGAFAVQCSDVAAANPVWALRTYSAEDLVLSPGGHANVNEKVRIKADTGNVGIGTDDPSYILSVVGDSGITQQALTNSTHGQLSIVGRNSAGNISAISRFKSYPDGSSNQSHFAIETRNSSAAMVEALRITSDQKVGIGTVSALTDLHIHSGTPRITMSDSGTGAHHRINADSSVGNFNFDIDYNSVTSTPAFIVNIKGNEKLRIKSTGDLILSGGIIYGEDNASNVLKLQSTSGNSNHSRIEIGASQSSDNGGIHFYTAGSSTATRHMTLKGTTGYLGIGVDDPNNPLTIHGSSNHIYMKDTATNNILQIRHQGGTAQFNSFDLDGSARRDFVFEQYSTEVFRIRTSGNISVPDGEIETKQDYPDFRPTLDFNFAAVKKLDSRIKYTRTGRASYYNEYGLLEIVNANVPRFDHDPDTRESLGLLVEESRTNLITNSDAPAPNTGNLGGGAQTNGTATTTVPTGEIGTVREYLANASGGGIRFGDFSGTNNTTYSGSLWVRTVSGTGSVIIDMNDGGVNTQSISTQWKRLTATHAVDATYRFIDLYFGTPVTVYIWGVQIEAAPNMSSYIPTRGAAGTRGPDIVVIDGQNFTDFYNPVESTVLAVGTIQRPASAQGQLNIIHIGDSNEDGHGVFREHGTKDVWYHIRNGNSTPSGGNLNPSGFGDWDADEEARIAMAFKDGDQAISVNGGNQITATVTSSYPTSDITKMWIGSHGNGSYFDGTISRIAYYGKQLTDSQLNTLTA